MKKITIAYLFISSVAFAADISISKPATITVDNCNKGEIGSIRITESSTGVHTLTPSCLPLICVDTHDHTKSNRSNKWKIGLLPRIQKAAKPTKFLGVTWKNTYPKFNLEMVRILNYDIDSKKERDALISKYISEGTCLERYHVPQDPLGNAIEF